MTSSDLKNDVRPVTDVFTWDVTPGRETEFEEILGYHLEQAVRYRRELGPLDDHGRDLAGRPASPA